MIKLYWGSGAQDLEVLGKSMPADKWDALRRMSCKMLRAKGQHEAAQLLEEMPFEVCEGTNGFGDDFQVLFWSAPFDQYVEVLEKEESRVYGRAFIDIAKTVSEIAHVYIRFVAIELDTDEGPAPVTTPSLLITSDVVERALRDAERLISAEGAISGLDRVHTALHGYLRMVCDKRGIQHSPDASITELFKALRLQHPAFSVVGAQAAETQRVVMAFATVVDALNPVRNQASMAHPNATLLAEPEATLVINAVRTLLHYLNAKIR